uniref:Late embryogenesis abundant protein LEA-2 subgroup domain-containing protein n=1 Tax=Arundo donax TaxID=35708 RepID=A0A0A9DDH3_ARUDO
MQRPTGRAAAVPRPPPDHAVGRPLPRPPPSYATDRPVPRPPAASPGHYAADRPVHSPPASPPGHYAAERPVPRPPPASPPGQYSPERPVPRPPPASPPGQYSPERPVPRPPGPYDAADRPVPRPPGHYAYGGGTARRSALASCLAAAAFLLLAAGGAGTALFLLFRPRPPDIAVAAVRLPSFAAANGTVAFTFQQTAVVRNPNRSPFAHFDSSLRVAYAGGQLGSVYIPAGLIDGGRAKDMSASFDVPPFPAATQPPPEIAASAAAQQQQQPVVMEVDSLLVVKGRVTVLRVLTHRVQAAKVCRVGVSPIDGRVLGFRC